MRKIILTLLVLSSLLFNPNIVHAASTTIGFSPQLGSFDKSFTVSLVIDGHGDKFNAAQATVVIPSNLAIKDLILGDCNFSFLKTPSIQQPSFTGIILNKYSTKCTIYTLVLVPISKGNATISLSKVSVKRYGDASNILSSTQEGKYSLNAALKAPSVLGTSTTDASQNGLYTLNLKIITAGDTPVTKATVNLNSLAKKNQVKTTTDANGLAIFKDVKDGIYSVIIEKDGSKIGETIINVSGQNHVLTLSINIDAQKNNPLMKKYNPFLDIFYNYPLFIICSLLIGLLLGVFITIALIKKK